ncbi:trimeric intracellular cation channel family protein [Schaalia sp. ZJ405]|uniref:trimeric intracellular cation channel family protein n=1 Tax=unclassified Schaalia TaxID=2691889 RepID=UPI0013EA71BD|nr:MULTISPECIES: trimeric intracellular cation channel family protein [unclassified Schaalia]QPK81455.1 trimeric intracellular cation channel family protein [Schaalia sp. ZJ405]
MTGGTVLDMLNETLPDLFRAIELLGVLLNGILGGRLARMKNFDAVGFAVLAIMSALAGGMLRDVLLQAGPPIALTDPYYLGTALVGAGIAMLWKLESRPWRIALILADGTVLGCWAATGALKTLDAGFGWVPAIMLGITTAVGGGMIRDVSAGNIPMVFGGNNLYATPALVSSIIMVAFHEFDLNTIGILIATIVGSSFTVVAHWRKWQLPQTGEWTLTLTASQLRRLINLGRTANESDEGNVRDVT